MEPLTLEDLRRELAGIYDKMGALDERITKLDERLTGKIDALESRMIQLNIDLEVRLDNRFLAFEERMEKRFDQFEDRFLKVLAGYVEANDRRFSRNERAISDLMNRQPPQ